MLLNGHVKSLYLSNGFESGYFVCTDLRDDRPRPYFPVGPESPPSGSRNSRLIARDLSVEHRDVLTLYC